MRRRGCRMRRTITRIWWWGTTGAWCGIRRIRWGGCRRKILSARGRSRRWRNPEILDRLRRGPLQRPVATRNSCMTGTLAQLADPTLFQRLVFHGRPGFVVTTVYSFVIVAVVFAGMLA